MFRFIVKYLGFLKHIPYVALLFDCMLRLWLLLTKPEILDCLDEIEAEIKTWPRTTTSLHKYGGMQFNCNGKEIGHIHSNGILDICFSRKIKQQLMAEGRISDHHVFANSGWISFYIMQPEDGLYAAQILRMAYLMVCKRGFSEENKGISPGACRRVCEQGLYARASTSSA